MKRLNLLFKFGVLCMVLMSIMACGANDNVEESQEQYVSDSVSEQKSGKLIQIAYARKLLIWKNF